MTGTFWPDGPTEKLRELYLDPARITYPVIVERLNRACGTAYTVKAIDARLRRLGIINRSDPSIWASPRDTILRELYSRADAPSYSVIAQILNERAGSSFSRCAVASKVFQLNLGRRLLPKDRATTAPPRRAPRAVKIRARACPSIVPAETIKLRCVEIQPRNISLTDLEPDHCRYPYGGDEIGETVTFCGHSKMEGSSYCAPHFHLCRHPQAISKRAATQGRSA